MLRFLGVFICNSHPSYYNVYRNNRKRFGKVGRGKDFSLVGGLDIWANLSELAHFGVLLIGKQGGGGGVQNEKLQVQIIIGLQLCMCDPN